MHHLAGCALREVERDDVQAYYVDASNTAASLGNVRAANMVIIGALLKITNMLPLETVIETMNDVISARNKSLLEINAAAIKKGYSLV
jgi:2-oxoglutarate ferredoxin oxidoreductase subunit gamma